MSLIIAAQDQLLNMHYQRNIMKQTFAGKCRMCYKVEEHVKHIVAGCTTLAPFECTNIHNMAAGYIHWTICKAYGVTGY